MESRIRILLLTVALASLGGCSLWPFKRHPKPEEPIPVEASSAEGGSPAVVDPEVKRRKIKTPRIKSSDFEIGAFVGTYSAEDFGVNPSYGARLDYHISEDFFAEALLGRTNTGRTSYEELSGSADLLTPAQRRLTYYELGFGYNLFPGEVFIGRGRAFNSAVYVTTGVGATQFAGADHFTIALGAGYRLLLNDWMVAHIDVHDHIFQVSLLGDQKTTHNLETGLGLTFFF
jgi:outer membrane beta-barrel protein